MCFRRLEKLYEFTKRERSLGNVWLPGRTYSEVCKNANDMRTREMIESSVAIAGRDLIRFPGNEGKRLNGKGESEKNIDDLEDPERK